jgi:ribosome modulation factor
LEYFFFRIIYRTDSPEPLSASDLFGSVTDHDMKTNAEILKARMEGATAALEGRKLDANNYDETDELHFDWLAGWTSARAEQRKIKTRSDFDGAWDIINAGPA